RLAADASQVAGNERGAVWERVLAVLGSQTPAGSASVISGSQQLLAYPRLGRRLASQLNNAGLVLMIASALVMWSETRTIESPVLLSGVETFLPTLAETGTQLISLQDLETDGVGGKASASVLWSRPGESTSLAMTLTDSRWRLHRGFWVRISDVVPALSLRVIGSDGSPLMLQPVVGDRKGITEYRAALDGEEEHVLTVPEARTVLRVSTVTGDASKDQAVIELLDGGLGTVIDRLRLPAETTLRVEGMTVDARMEHALVLTMWRLPGLALVVLGAVMAAAGAVLRRVLPPWRVWIGFAPVGQEGEWQILLATDPEPLAEVLVSRLSSQPE
ncbi:MAG: hypothetical protein ACYCYF_02475, partial [Anaerolineae bacterium]